MNERARHNYQPKEREDNRECIVTHLHDLRDIDITLPQFYRLALQLKEVTTSCMGQMSRHHILYRSEFGKDTADNLIDCCMGHQKFIHSSYVWGGTDFSFLLNNRRNQRRRH